MLIPAIIQMKISKTLKKVQLLLFKKRWWKKGKAEINSMQYMNQGRLKTKQIKKKRSEKHFTKLQLSLWFDQNLRNQFCLTYLLTHLLTHLIQINLILLIRQNLNSNWIENLNNNWFEKLQAAYITPGTTFRYAWFK